MESPLSPGRRRHAGIRTAGAVVAMVLAGLGIAEAQTSGTTDTTAAQAPAAQEAPAAKPKPGKPRMVSLEVAAKAIGITVEELRTALRSGQSIAQVAQSKNVEPQKVVDALVTHITAALPERITEAVNRAGGPGKGGHRGHRGHHGPKATLSVAATALGMSEADLRAALRSGQSLAQVAQSKNVDPQKVVDALVADAQARLNRTGRP